MVPDVLNSPLRSTRVKDPCFWHVCATCITLLATDSKKNNGATINCNHSDGMGASAPKKPRQERNVRRCVGMGTDILDWWMKWILMTCCCCTLICLFKPDSVLWPVGWVSDINSSKLGGDFNWLSVFLLCIKLLWNWSQHYGSPLLGWTLPFTFMIFKTVTFVAIILAENWFQRPHYCWFTKQRTACGNETHTEKKEPTTSGNVCLLFQN